RQEAAAALPVQPGDLARAADARRAGDGEGPRAALPDDDGLRRGARPDDPGGALRGPLRDGEGAGAALDPAAWGRGRPRRGRVVGGPDPPAAVHAGVARPGPDGEEVRGRDERAARGGIPADVGEGTPRLDRGEGARSARGGPSEEAGGSA